MYIHTENIYRVDLQRYYLLEFLIKLAFIQNGIIQQENSFIERPFCTLIMTLIYFPSHH